MEELAGFFSGLGRRGRLLILLVPGLAYAYSLALYAVFVYPRAVDAGIAPGQGELFFALALFAAFWGGQIFDVKVSLAKLMKGECENLERLSVKGAKSNLNIKLGQLAGFAVVYLVTCVLPLPPGLSTAIVFGTLFWLERVITGTVHRACVLGLVKERDRNTGSLL